MDIHAPFSCPQPETIMQLPRRPEAELDIECFHNWFLIGFTDVVTGQEWDYQMFEGGSLDLLAIEALLRHFTIVTFNGANYDMLMLMLALKGASCSELKAANDRIIVGKLKWWDFYKQYNCWPPDWIDHIDVSEPTPGVRVSLKQYMCRMNSKLVQDSPVDFNLPLPVQDAPHEIDYCRNDRKGTRELRAIIDERIQLRIKMSERYGVDLRSKSDAQMAEAMVKAEWTRRMTASIAAEQYDIEHGLPPVERYWHQGVDYTVDWKGVPKVTIPKYAHGTTFKARIPAYVEFATPYMNQLLNDVRNCDFFISDKDEAEMLGYESPHGKNFNTGVMIPEVLNGRDIVIGSSTYRVGIGGLHSQESGVTYRTIPGVQQLRTADVTSYYPSMIINTAMNPPQLGPLFLEIYKGFYNSRIESKKRMRQISDTITELKEKLSELQNAQRSIP